MYSQYGNNAKQRGHEFRLSKEEFRFLTSKPCAYCGTLPKPYHAKNRKAIKPLPYMANGLDRINNALGYVEGNCVPCCGTCNYMKREMSAEQFRTQIMAIFLHLGTLLNG